MAHQQPCLQEKDLILRQAAATGSSNDNSRQLLSIISGVAGTGKSTLLSQLYEEIKATKGKDYWVVRVNLTDHQKLFQMLQRESAEVNVIHFLVSLPAVIGQSSFSRSLLRHRLKTGDRIVLMLDGFDEIDSQCQTATIRLLKSVPLVDLYVTTRSHASSELQFQLSRLSFTLDNFSHQDRIDCLTKFWSSHLNADDLTGTVQVVMETMARSLIDRLSKTLNASESFIGRNNRRVPK